MNTVQHEAEGSILGELVAILYGVAAATIVEDGADLVLRTQAHANEGVEAHFAAPNEAGFVLLTLALVVLAVRFFHGNLRSIAFNTAAGWRRSEEAYSLGVVVLQGVLFGAMGRFMGDMQALSFCVVALFVSNALLFAIASADHRQDLPGHQRCWGLLAALALFMLLPMVWIFHLSAWQSIVTVIAATTVIDYLWNWAFYFVRQEAPVSQRQNSA